MRSSVHHVSHKLWQRKFLNKHLRFPIHDFHPFVHPPLVSKSYTRWVGRTWLVLVSVEWETALTAVFRVPVCSRTNTDSVLYLFLTCTRPPDSDADRNQLVIASQLHLTFIGIKFWALRSATLRMSYHRHHWIISFGVHLMTRFLPSSSTGVMGLSSTPNYNAYVQEHM